MFKGKTYRPGDLIQVRSSRKVGTGRWTGFARSETALEMWSGSYNIDLDIPADGFAERNREASKKAGTRVETECDLATSLVIYALGERKTGGVRILTREASEGEKSMLGHHRVPVTGPARFQFPTPETELQLSPGA